MLIRFRNAIGLALLLAVWMVIIVSAKGGFSFITISGANLQEVLRSNDIALTEDFFAFADFYRDRVDAPVDPGVGYEITRYYLDGGHEIAFDRLHYYPATGFVYYDGIVNGSSEYDGGWYTAQPEIKSVFESAIAGAATIPSQSVGAEKNTTTDPVTGSAQPNFALDQTSFLLPIGIAAGLAAAILILVSRRKISAQSFKD
jgi:hypothetical protein